VEVGKLCWAQQHLLGCRWCHLDLCTRPAAQISKVSRFECCNELFWRIQNIYLQSMQFDPSSVRLRYSNVSARLSRGLPTLLLCTLSYTFNVSPKVAFQFCCCHIAYNLECIVRSNGWRSSDMSRRNYYPCTPPHPECLRAAIFNELLGILALRIK